jgi:type II secretory pathway pseudopilin PulG
MNNSVPMLRSSNVIVRRGCGPKRRVGGFTLVELLVVIVVIMLLATIVAPFTNVAGERARQSKCRSRLIGIHKGVAAYGAEHGNRVPLVNEATSFATIGKLLPSGGRFAEKYLKQSWSLSGNYARMRQDDHVFQCPSSMGNIDGFDKDVATNYQLSAFGLDTGRGAAKALHPNMLTIMGSVQKVANTQSGFKTHPAGRIVMAMDWLWSRQGEGLGGYRSGASLANHRDGANVLYGTGSAEWVSYEKMLKVPSVPGFRRPPGTYGFIKSGSSGTHIFAPCGEVIKPGAAGDRKAGAGVMW